MAGEIMWEHFCDAEGCILGTEKDKECNWCGKTESDSQESQKTNDEKL